MSGTANIIRCIATTKSGRPCKGEASRWPRGVEAVRGDNFVRAEQALRRLNTKGDAEKLAAIAAITNEE